MYALCASSGAEAKSSSSPGQGGKVLFIEESVEDLSGVLVRRPLGVNEPYGQLARLCPGHLSKATPETWTFTTGLPMPVMDSTLHPAEVTLSCTSLATLTTLQP